MKRGVGEVRIVDADLDSLRSDLEELKTEVIKMKIDWNKDRNELRLAVQNLKIKTGLEKDTTRVKGTP